MRRAAICGTLQLALLLALAAPAPAADGVPILMYHRIERDRGPLSVAPARFAAQVRALAAAGYTAITLDALRAAWVGRVRLPRRPVVLTFDDGYASQWTAAAPVLRERGWPGVLDLTERRLRARGGLSGPRVRALLRSGWELAAHSRTHPRLTGLGDAALRREVAGARRVLRARFGVAVGSFCHPYGVSDARVRRAVRRAGFALATGTREGLARETDDPYDLPRVRVGARDTAARLLARLRALEQR